ncbi:MAG: Gfo/Idh/MocA family oxidoreductase [Phycisphaeraceae bacterium]
MPVRIAFVGFRHGHILELYKAAQASDTIDVVAAGEDHRPTRDQLASDGTVTFTHDHAERVIDEVDCDAIAIGDYYARRGPLAIRAMQRGRHVILDKPICTRLDELERMAELASANGLAVGCQLSLRGGGAARTARRLIGEGAIGEPCTVTFTGQHPLMRGRRPGWYFEPGKHGGTINDIAVHGLDALPWLTGRAIAEVIAARAWNPTLPESPHFQVAAQLMLRLDGGGGVLGDVSYLAPEAAGYEAPQYWRFTIHGSGGVVELGAVNNTLTRMGHDDAGPVTIAPDPARPAGYLVDFLCEVAGEPVQAGGVTTQQVLTAARWSLEAQRIADAAWTVQ